MTNLKVVVVIIIKPELKRQLYSQTVCYINNRIWISSTMLLEIFLNNPTL